MSVRRSVGLVAVMLALSVGCARGSGGPQPNQRVELDAGNAGIDGGSTAENDGGAPIDPQVDAGTPEEPIDAGTPIDSGTVVIDGGPPPFDAGTDAGPITGADAGPPCTPLPALIAEVSGSTTGGPTFARPNSMCPASQTTAGVRYATHVFCNTSLSTTFDFEVSGSIPDSYLVVYDGTGIPADTRQCLARDDDSAGAGQAYIADVAVAAGQTITVVVTGFDSGDSGDYTLSILRN